MKSARWTAVSQSAFEWEREALDFLRDHLPDHEPWRAWATLKFGLCLPAEIIGSVLKARTSDPAAVAATCRRELRLIAAAE